MKYSIYVNGRLSRKGNCAKGISRIAAPEGATLRVSGGAAPAWYWRTENRWQKMPFAAPGSQGVFGLTWDELEAKQGGKLTRDVSA